ncbi:MAG: hypothetical protein ACO3AG_01790 [Fluviibacter sp.]
MSQETISAAENPALAQKLIQAALSGQMDGSYEEPQVEEPMKIVAPPSDEVELIAGIYNAFTGEMTKTATIRELTGVDEEAFAKISDYGRVILAILQRGTVRIGSENASQELLDSLLTGDRELLTMKIRVATFGKDLELIGSCPHCESEQTFSVDLEKDVEIVGMDEPTVRSFTVQCKVGEVEVEYPNGALQRKLIGSSDKTAAELDTILLKGCINSINGMPLVNPDDVKKLGILDRRTILMAINERNPGPNLAGVKKNCSSCGLEVPIPLTLADLFRL